MKIKKLPGDYIAGLVDGEGCFYLTFRSETRRERANCPTYFRWIAYFAMNLRKDDIEILNQVKETLECGNVYVINKRGEEMAYYGIQHLDHLFTKIVPFFAQFPLRAKKKYDFELWKKALVILFHKKCGFLKVN